MKTAEQKIAIGCTVYMKSNSGCIGYGNIQCVKSVCEPLGEIGLYGHNQHYKIEDIDKIVSYPSASHPPAAPVSGEELTDVESVIFFELKRGRYLTKSGKEVTSEMVMNAEHYISDDVAFIKVPATLPTREQGAKGCQCKQDYKSVMIAGYTYCQNCGERK